MALSVGDQLGQYTIQGILGYGGMASVYKAYHARLNRHVAIKVIHAGSEAAFLERFEREAQIVAVLDHPNIVPVYDFADRNGQPYLVMKFIDGFTLKAILATGTLNSHDMLNVLMPIATALDYAHGCGVLHRDIKPSNILIDRNTTPYLTDFGLARLTLSPESTISEGMLLGTPHYIAPEQVLGRQIDHRADLYSFGVLLYEIIVGKVPFSGGTPYSILQDHVNSELPRPREINPELPSSIETLLFRSMAKLPAERFNSASEMISQLAAIISSNGVYFSSSQSKRHNSLEETLAELVTSPDLATNHPAITKHTAVRVGRRHAWLIASLGLTALCILAITLLMINLLHERNRGITTETIEPIRILDIQELGLVEARFRQRNNPQDPIVYLELAYAQYAQGLDQVAEATITDGFQYAPDKITYLMTAANLALDTEQFTSAVLTFIQLLHIAEGTPRYPMVRSEVGQNLYQIAGEANRLSANQLRNLSQELQAQESPVVAAMLSHALIQNGALAFADLTLRRALTLDGALAETHLVLGELYYSRDEIERARSEWMLARDRADAPEWVRQTAQQYLDETSQQG